MKLTVYIDVLITVNMIINYYIFKITAVIANIPYRHKKIVIASVIGAGFSLLVFIDDINIVISMFLKVCSVLLCGYLAFDFTSFFTYIRCILYLLAANTLLAGIFMFLFQYSDMIYINNLCWYINISPFMLVICIVSVYAVIWLYDLVAESKERFLKSDFKIVFNGKNRVLTGFYDTGFGVKDIIGRRPVVLCRFSDISEALEPRLRDAVIDFFIRGDISDKRIIPIFYSDITAGGMLPSVRRDRFIHICDNKEIKDVLIAVTDKKISGDVQMIFGKEIYNMIGDYL